jgi:hypothetical protein
MEDDDWIDGRDADGESPALTMAIVELTSTNWPTSRRAFAWVGMDSAPRFPRLQRYLARLSLAQNAEIDRIRVQSSGLEHAIDLRFDVDRPTIH